MPNFTIEGRLKGLPDPQRDFLWEVTILNFDLGDSSPEDLTLRAKNISIPGRSNEPIETYFYGHKQKFSGRSAFSNQISIQFEETEDQKILRTFYHWFQKINNTDPLQPFATLSTTLTKRQYAKRMFLTMYKYNGEEVRNKIEFVNVFPESIADVALDMTSNAAVKYDVQFSYDYWTLQGPDRINI